MTYKETEDVLFGEAAISNRGHPVAPPRPVVTAVPRGHFQRVTFTHAGCPVQ